MNGQDDVTRHHKTHGSAEEGIASEMITGGDAGEANGAGHAVGYERYPAMPAIPVSDHGGYGGCCHGVARKESARMERIMRTVEETVSGLPRDSTPEIDGSSNTQDHAVHA